MTLKGTGALSRCKPWSGGGCFVTECCTIHTQRLGKGFSCTRLAAFQTLGLYQTSCAQLTIVMLAGRDMLLCVLTTWYINISIAPIEQHIFMLPLRSHSAHVHDKERAMPFVRHCLSLAYLLRCCFLHTSMQTHLWHVWHLCKHSCTYM